MAHLYGSGGNEPSADKNQESTQVINDPELEGKTPEFVEQMIEDLNEVRRELSLLFSQMFAPVTTFGMESLQAERQAIINHKRMLELEEKEYELATNIRRYAVLIWPAASNALQGLGVES